MIPGIKKNRPANKNFLINFIPFPPYIFDGKFLYFAVPIITATFRCRNSMPEYLHYAHRNFNAREDKQGSCMYTPVLIAILLYIIERTVSGRAAGTICRTWT
jgi:hypothetical protein